MNNSVTFTKRIQYTRHNLTYLSLRNVIQVISTGDMPLYDSEYGNYTLKQAIEHIRSLNTPEIQTMKARLLPAVAYNGKFAELNGTGLIEYSCMTALDFDHIATPDEMVRLRNRLIKTPCVLCVFVTPSGKGLKALVWHDNTDSDKHGDLYGQLLDKFYVANRNDASCRDLARRNYLSYDPDVWTNPNPIPYHYIPIIKPKATPVYPSGRKTVSDRSIINIMNSIWKKNNPEYWMEGHRASCIFKLACLLCKWGVDENLAAEYFIDGWISVTMDEEEILRHVTNAYKTKEKNFGTLEFNTYK